MTERETLETLTRILREVLGDESIELARETTRPDVPRWDSFAYVTFIVAVETEFGIRFPVSDVESFQTVGDIVDRIGTLRT